MFGSELIVKLDKETWAPGEPVSGKLYVTSKHPFKVSSILVSMKGSIHTHGRYDVEDHLHKWDHCESEQWRKWDRETGHKGCPNIEFNVGDDRQEVSGSFDVDKDGVRDHPGTAVSRNHRDLQRRNPVRNDELHVLDYSEEINLDTAGLGSRKFKNGLTVVPFLVNAPLSETASCIPSGSVDSNSLKVEIKYYVQAIIYYPSSYYWFGTDRINFRWSSWTPLDVYFPPFLGAAGMDLEISSAYQVEQWDEDSMAIGNLVKYAVGRKTSIASYPMVLNLRLPALLEISGRTEPTFVSDFMHLETLINNKDAKVILCPEMIVSELSVTLDTVVAHNKDLSCNTSVPKWSLHKRTNLGSLKKASVPFNPEKGMDLRPLIGGFTLPEDVLSTCLVPALQVYHFISVKLKVKVNERDTDGTKQAPTEVRVGGLLNVRRVQSFK